jgi:hypothetical protein
MPELNIEISAKLKEAIVKERFLISQLNSIEPKISALKKEVEDHEEKFGWKESFLGGFFGGDRELVKSVEARNAELIKLEKQLKELATRLTETSRFVKAELAKQVGLVDKGFQSIVAEKDHWLNFEKKSKAYHSLVKKSHQGIVDALLFASWEKLINHPQAKAKLSEFRGKTAEYQKVISEYSEPLKSMTGDIVIFDELIKFSSEQVAMSSFGVLAKKSKEYEKLAYDKVEDLLKLMNARLEEVKLKVVG